jgi:hypothetical protein
MAALQQAEAAKSEDPLVRLFADDAELENPARSVTRQGTDGARAFWRDYLSAFDRVRSEFTRVSPPATRPRSSGGRTGSSPTAASRSATAG